MATEITKQLQRDLMSAFKNGSKSMRWPGFFALPDKTSEILTRELGITSDCNETKLGGGVNFAFLVRFDWNCQRWFVGV